MWIINGVMYKMSLILDLEIWSNWKLSKVEGFVVVVVLFRKIKKLFLFVNDDRV